jgi:hypothetical protein
MEASENSGELDALRIRRWAALRRSAYRSRSYAVIAAAGCIGAAGELVYLAIPHLRAAGGIVWGILYLVGVVLLLVMAAYFGRLTLVYHRQARESALAPPAKPPDFSALCDGSQILKNLENIE